MKTDSQKFAAFVSSYCFHLYEAFFSKISIQFHAHRFLCICSILILYYQPKFKKFHVSPKLLFFSGNSNLNLSIESISLKLEKIISFHIYQIKWIRDLHQTVCELLSFDVKSTFFYQFNFVGIILFSLLERISKTFN